MRLFVRTQHGTARVSKRPEPSSTLRAAPSLAKARVRSRFCALLLIVVTACAQQPTSTVRFSTSTNLVIVDVTVKDKAGSAIENLRKDDFTVLEDGKPQKLVVFEVQKLSLEPAPPEPPPSFDDKAELPDDPKTTITVETPGKVQ